MANEQMGMAAAAPAPEEMAIFDQMRQNISPKEFSDEMLAGASQADPQAVAQFKKELDALDVPPEVLDALNNLVDEILANPDQYDAIRKKYMDQGIPEDILPEQFDPHFFAALNMAIDQLIAAPAGEQAFAKGGIAELKPIHKAIASYGRNGDTMLAHITPAEARMLKRKGGAGTTNPKTGLPEFFSLKGMFKSLGNAVKSFASSSVGRIVTTVALGMILGPAAAAALGAEGAAAAAISGFVGGAGSTLLAGGNLRDALKAGAVSGVMAGAGSAIMGPSAAATPKPEVPVVDLSTPAVAPPVTPEAVAGAPVAPTGAETVSATQAPGGAPTPAPTTVAPPVALPDATAVEGTLAKSLTPTGSTSLLDQAKDFYTNNLSPSGIRAAAEPAAQQAGMDAMEAMRTRLPNATPAMLDQAYQTAYKAAMPGVLSTYGPVVGAGLGIMGLTGGFSASQPPSSPLKSQLMKPATQRIAEEGTGKQYYVQGLPGVQYDASGAPIYGSANPLPTTGLPNYGGGFSMPGTIGGLASLAPPPAMYSSPAGTIGSRKVAQPYNTADMYSNLLYPQRYAEGGEAATKTPEQIAAEKKASEEAAAKLAADQKAAREEVARQKAMRKAQGSGTMYANINAGLAARAPEVNPMDSTDTTFGARNRAAQQTALEQQYGSMFAGQRNALNQQTGIMASGQLPRDISGYSAQDKGQLYMQLARQGLTDAQIRAAAENAYGVQTDNDWRMLQGVVGQMQQPAPGTVPPPNFGMTPPPGSGMTPPSDLGIIPPPGIAPFPGTSPDTIETIDMTTGARVGGAPGSGGGMSIQGGLDQYGNLYGSQPYHYGRGPLPVAPDFAFLPGAQMGPPKTFMNTGGIAALAQGGYPRMNGQISGPGTEKSDSIPAMLSDGEFVMTAKAVRGAGKGNRREGAKKMYQLMHQLERNAQRG